MEVSYIREVSSFRGVLREVFLCNISVFQDLLHFAHTIQPHQQESVRGLTTCVFDDHPVILTGGTDRIVRLWNLRDPDRCCCVVKPKYLKRIQFDYQ